MEREHKKTILSAIDTLISCDMRSVSPSRSEVTNGVCAVQLATEIASDYPELADSAKDIRAYYSDTSKDPGALSNGWYTSTTIRRYTEAAKDIKSLFNQIED